MTIKQQGGVFGRNPTFNNVEVESLSIAGNAVPDASTILVDSDIGVSVQGYDADTAKLDVAQTFTDAQTFRGNGTSVNLQWASDGGSQGVSFKNSAGTTLWDISGGVLERQDELAFRRQGSSVLYLDNSSNVRISSGNLVIGTSGQGIDFSATAGTGTSELFDDYEEGAWTPVIRGAGTAGTYEQVVTRATYTKVGRQVTLQCYLALASAVTGGGTSYLQITGAPFAALSVNQFPTTVLLTDMAKSVTTLYVGVSWSNTTTMYFPEVQPTAFADFPIANAVANKTIQFTMTYFV